MEHNSATSIMVTPAAPSLQYFSTQKAHHVYDTHTHPFNGPFSRTTRVGRYQKGKTNLDFTKSRDSEWQWHQLAYSSLHLAPDRQPRQHLTTQFFTGRMPFLPPNQQRQSTEGNNFANAHVSKMIDPVCDIYITDLLAHSVVIPM